MSKKILGVVLALVGSIVGLVGVVCTVGWIGCGGNSSYEPAEVVRDTVIDTIPYYKPVPKDSFVVKYNTVTLPTSDKTLPYIRADTKATDSYTLNSVADIGDSAEVVIPISQKMYNSSDYTAWVSGYDVQLDSIYVYPKHEYVTRKIKQPPKKWHIGLTAGYGFGKQGMQPYIGIGLTYSLISF